MIGQALKSNTTYKDMIDKEGRRCWTILYNEQNGIKFHIDVLPSVPEKIDIIEDTTIATTTRIKENNVIRGYEWDSTNPIAYALWFENINKKSYESVERRYRSLLFENNKNLDDVPKELVKTKLQKIIQLLKRHRDIRFLNSKLKNAKPMSMIITTLVSEVYQYVNVESEDILTTIKKIISELSQYKILRENDAFVSRGLIKRINGEWKIKNPVADENLADRWHENNDEKAKAFFKWIDWLEKDFINIDERKLNEGMDLSDYLLRDEEIKDKVPTIEIDRNTKPWKAC